MTEHTFDNPRGVTFEVEPETRTLRGLALPFGDVGDNGLAEWTFAKGSLTWDKVKLLNGHDWQQVIGLASLEETDEGLVMTAKVARTALGDEVLALAEMGAIDGLSVGLTNDLTYEARNGVNHVTAGVVAEVSTTPLPAFAGAQIRSVAASAAPTKEGNPMTDQTTEVAEAQFATAAEVTELSKRLDQLADIKVPVAAASFEVREEPIYRFSGHTPAPSGFDFATDMLAAANGDGAALSRIREFTAERLGPSFVDTTDTASVNPSQYRPDMFLGQAPVPASPMYDFFRKGTLSDVTPFFHTKLDRTATTVAVANHTEGVEPTPTDLVTATGATVTPSPVSGKVHITREVADQGGNPQVSALVWAEFERSYKIALETKTTALLAASADSITSLTTAIAAGADGATAGAALERGLLGLQFLADGSRFEKAFGHVDLYTALATYENADGEKRYPIINPQNRDGVTGAKYSFIDIAGYRMEPGTSLGATSTAASLSYVADPNAVHVWNSGLQRLEKLQEKVEGWDLGVFGYFAGLVYDVTGLRKISYDPTV